jgi:transcriptional regulator with XRE-family HTH domain
MVFAACMRATQLQAAANRRAAAVIHDLAEHLRRLADDAGVTVTALAAAAGLSPSYVARILAGTAKPTVQTYLRLGAVLGADFSAKYFPTTGPQVRDRHQGRILEVILQERHARWDPFTEVRVHKPDRGWIDLALHEPREHVIVAHEIQSELNRVEQLVRWQQAKAASLPSWEGWPQLVDEPKISSALIVRRTKASRAVAQEFERQLRVSYPAHPDDALAALRGTAPWPGPAMVWAVIEGARTRLIGGR